MSFRKHWSRWAVAAAAVAMPLGALAGTAAAAGSGYGPGTPSAPGATGAFSQVVSVQTVPASGGTVTAVVNGATITVTIPAGDFTAPVQVVFTAGDLTTIGTGGVGGTPVVAFGVQIDQNSQKLPGPFANPILVSAADSGITASSQVYQEGANGFTAASGWTSAAGKASGSFSVDPDYLISNPAAAPTAIPGATTATTGKPFLGEGLLVLALLGLGGVGAWRWRRQVQATA